MKRFEELTQRGAGGARDAAPPSVNDVLAKREAAEAFTALTLDKLSAEILARADLSEWTKAQILSENLQKVLSHKAQGFLKNLSCRHYHRYHLLRHLCHRYQRKRICQQSSPNPVWRQRAA